MKFVYLAAPLSPIDGETVASNIQRAKEIYRALCLEHPYTVFLMPWVLNCEVFEDTPEFRAAGMARNFSTVELMGALRTSELWLVGPRISRGMDEEAKHALTVGLDIKCLVPGAVYDGRCPLGEHLFEGQSKRMICRRCGWAEWDDEPQGWDLR